MLALWGLMLVLDPLLSIFAFAVSLTPVSFLNLLSLLIFTYYLSKGV